MSLSQQLSYGLELAYDACCVINTINVFNLKYKKINLSVFMQFHPSLECFTLKGEAF